MPRERHISSTVLPSAWPASTERSSLTICSGVYVLLFMVVLSGPHRAISDSHTTCTNFRVADQRISWLSVVSAVVVAAEEQPAQRPEDGTGDRHQCAAQPAQRAGHFGSGEVGADADQRADGQRHCGGLAE